LFGLLLIDAQTFDVSTPENWSSDSHQMRKKLGLALIN
jgi:hypothetical protein